MQKRLGRRLSIFVKYHKGVNKSISERGKLTEKVINSTQNYYGMAIRNNVVGTHNMRKEMVAVLYHYTGFKMQE